MTTRGASYVVVKVDDQIFLCTAFSDTPPIGINGRLVVRIDKEIERGSKDTLRMDWDLLDQVDIVKVIVLPPRDILNPDTTSSSRPLLYHNTTRIWEYNDAKLKADDMIEFSYSHMSRGE